MRYLKTGILTCYAIIGHLFAVTSLVIFPDMRQKSEGSFGVGVFATGVIFLTATRRGRTPAAVLAYSAFLLFIWVHELFYTGKYRSVPLLICIPLLIVRLLFAMRSKKKEETDAQIQFVDLSICSNIRSGVRYKPQTADGKFLNASQSKSVLTDEIKQESPSDWALPETRKETARGFLFTVAVILSALLSFFGSVFIGRLLGIQGGLLETICFVAVVLVLLWLTAKVFTRILLTIEERLHGRNSHR